jgi:hypothetical protein
MLRSAAAVKEADMQRALVAVSKLRGVRDCTSWDASMSSILKTFAGSWQPEALSSTTLIRRYKSFLDEGSTALKKSGPKSTLIEYEERKVVKWVESATRQAQTPTYPEIRAKVQNILEGRGCDEKSVSDSWIDRFKDRHRLVTRTARSLAQDRSGVTQQHVAQFFMEYEEVRKDADLVLLPAALESPHQPQHIH